MILIDSDVVIAHLRGVGAARDWLVATRSAGDNFAISVVTVAEVRGGMRSGERTEVARFLGSMPWLPVDDRIAECAGDFQRRFRRSHPGIGIADYLIAATAQVDEVELATLNVKHFPMFKRLRPPFNL